MNDQDLAKIEQALADDHNEETSSALAAMLLRHSDDLVRLARRGMRAEQQTCSMCAFRRAYCGCIVQSDGDDAFCSRWKAKTNP